MKLFVVEHLQRSDTLVSDNLTKDAKKSEKLVNFGVFVIFGGNLSLF